MLYRILTDLTVAVHFAFLIFVVAGGFVARRYGWLAPPHLLAAAWGVYVEATPGLVCPLTPLENAFAIRAGEAGYQGSFIEHYPEGLTRGVQWGLAGFVVVINAVAYGWPRHGRAHTERGHERKGRSTMQSAFVVLRRRGSSWDESRPLEEQKDWPAHAIFMEALHAEGFVALAGPLEGTREALLVVRAGDRTEIEERLAHDPWTRNGLLIVKECWPWQIRLGSLV
jgi:uncharacterized protein YciI